MSKTLLDIQPDELLTRPREEIVAYQDARLANVMQTAWDEVGYYRQLWAERGNDPHQGPGSFEEWPLWNVTDLRRSMEENPPFGNLYTSAGLADIRFIHSSSGTTGKPRYAAFTALDEPFVSGAYGRIGDLIGVRRGDTICITGSYGLPIGAWSWTRMSQVVGATVVPAGSGRITPSDKLIDLIRDTEVSVMEGTPSYLLHVGRKALETGRGFDHSRIRLVTISGESATSAMRTELQELWGVDRVSQMYANSDVSWIGGECEVSSATHGEAGMHVLEDIARVEILDKDGEACGNSEYGELVLSSWLRPSTPRIRFRTGDRAAIDRTPCACGRTSARLLPLAGRTDDAIRFHGITVWPLAVDDVLAVLTKRKREFYLERSVENGHERLTVVMERHADEGPLDLDEVAEVLRQKLTVSFGMRLVGPGETQEFTGLGELPKTRRYLDLTK
jgi:phenylacetate-CoA ligase